MKDKLKKDAEFYLGWNQRKLDYFKKQHENIKELLKDPKNTQLKLFLKSDMIRTLHEIAYIKCFLLDPKDAEAREKIEKDLMNEIEELKSELKIQMNETEK